MKSRYLMLSLLIMLGLSGTALAGQWHGSSRQKAIVTFVRGDYCWYDLQRQSSPVLNGQGWVDELKGVYGRLPVRAKAKIRPAVWSLSENTAGLLVQFTTDAPEIRVCYQVTGGHAFPHMPATGVSGVDLYQVDENGKMLWSAGNYSFGDTIRYTFKNLNSYPAKSGVHEYQLFLPLYNGVKWMEIGITKQSTLSWIPPSDKNPVVVYGTSIAQGGCASRPGMAWPAILERELGYPVINLGFSGNGLLEPDVLNLINELDARLYILDCLPNLVSRPAPEIEKATLEAVRQIRTHHQTPILLVEHAGYTDGYINKERFDSYTRANKASRAAFNQLIAQGVRNIYYLSCEAINMPMDGTVDGTHPTDYGMRVYADAYEKAIRRIMHK